MTRSELIEAMARAVDPLAYAFGSRPDLRHQPLKNQERALAALEAATPGLSDLIDGTAVVMPVDMTGAMEDATETACCDGGTCCVNWLQYERLLAASPYGGKHE